MRCIGHSAGRAKNEPGGEARFRHVARPCGRGDVLQPDRPPGPPGVRGGDARAQCHARGAVAVAVPAGGQPRDHAPAAAVSRSALPQGSGGRAADAACRGALARNPGAARRAASRDRACRVRTGHRQAVRLPGGQRHAHPGAPDALVRSAAQDRARPSSCAGHPQLRRHRDAAGRRDAGVRPRPVLVAAGRTAATRSLDRPLRLRLPQGARAAEIPPGRSRRSSRRRTCGCCRAASASASPTSGCDWPACSPTSP